MAICFTRFGICPMRAIKRCSPAAGFARDDAATIDSSPGIF